VGGFPIQYSIKALRPDGTVRPSSGIVYSGTGVNSSGLFTPPETPGTYTVTASFDGKTVKSDTITVHPADYIFKPYTNIATGKTYFGYQGANWETKVIADRNITVTYPSGNNISADGYISIKGESKYSRKSYAYIYKSGDTSLVTSFTYGPGKFNLRIWMRFGPGLYNVYIDGIEFSVTNTCTDTGVEGDPRFKYPSEVVQSDDFRVTNILSDILYGVNNETDKIRKINDYLVLNTVYDFDSVNFDRKPQDASAVLGTRYHVDQRYEVVGGHYFAVCEGYSNAAAALLRAAGFEAKLVSSGPINHAWNNVYTGGSWKFLDVTWNDPVSWDNIDSGPLEIYWDKYFLLTTMDGVNGDHPQPYIDNFRSVNPVPVIPKMKGMPDGWY